MSKPLTLSDGTAVTLRPHYTHRAEREYNAIIMEGVTFTTEIVRDKDGEPMVDPKTKQIMEKTVPQGMKAENATKANEALILALIESASKDGAAIEPSQDWLENMAQDDFAVLEKSALSMKRSVDEKKATETKKS